MNNAPGDGRTPATVELLAAYKKLPPAWLHERFSLSDGVAGVIMPYPSRSRRRQFVETSQPTYWDENRGREITAYVDAVTLGEARKCGELVIGEGESDRWTLELHGIPALGVPGCSMTQYINAEHAVAIRRIYTIREPGKGGKTLVDGVVKRLCELQFRGELFIVDVQGTCGVKDPSDLHVRDPQAFEAQWKRAIESAAPVLVAWPEIYPRPVLHPLALHGLAGDFVRLVAPQSEAAEAALLLQFLSSAGIAMGANAYHTTESTKQYPRLNVLLLGPTSHGRKGTAMDHVKRVFTIADEEFVKKHFASGVISGEGLYRRCAGKDGQAPHDERRLVVIEPEFAKVLDTCEREGNSLSANIRELYDSGTIEIMRSNEPLEKAQDVHVGFIGHCTTVEYRKKLTEVAIANGFANRFLLACVERAHILPFGGDKLSKTAFDEIGLKLNYAMRFAKELRDKEPHGEVPWSDDAHDLYARFYYQCAQEAPFYPPLIGSMLGRLETIVLRVALTFALLAEKSEIGVDDLRAAIAVGAYGRSSTLYAFRPELGDSKAGKILLALRGRDDKQMTRTEIYRGLFGNNRRADELRGAFDLLTRQRLVASTSEKTGGAPRESFRAIGPGDDRCDPHMNDTLITLIT